MPEETVGVSSTRTDWSNQVERPLEARGRERTSMKYFSTTARLLLACATAVLISLFAFASAASAAPIAIEQILNDDGSVNLDSGL